MMYNTEVYTSYFDITKYVYTHFIRHTIQVYMLHTYRLYRVGVVCTSDM